MLYGIMTWADSVCVHYPVSIVSSILYYLYSAVYKYANELLNVWHHIVIYIYFVIIAYINYSIHYTWYVRISKKEKNHVLSIRWRTIHFLLLFVLMGFLFSLLNIYWPIVGLSKNYLWKFQGNVKLNQWERERERDGYQE